MNSTPTGSGLLQNHDQTLVLRANILADSALNIRKFDDVLSSVRIPRVWGTLHDNPCLITELHADEPIDNDQIASSKTVLPMLPALFRFSVPQAPVLLRSILFSLRQGLEVNEIVLILLVQSEIELSFV